MTYFFFWINLISTAVMVGLIWMVQLVHYPFFHRLSRSSYEKHMDEHRSKISLIVIPVMLAELASALALTFSKTQFQAEFTAGLILLAGIWASTFFLQVPAHQNISAGYNPSQVEKLVRTNWIRTILWTLRLALLLYVLTRLSFSGIS